MIAIAFLMFVGLLAVGVVGLVVARAATLDYERTKSRLHEAHAETLVYDVPHGRDAVDVMLALSRGGYKLSKSAHTAPARCSLVARTGGSRIGRVFGRSSSRSTPGAHSGWRARRTGAVCRRALTPLRQRVQRHAALTLRWVCHGRAQNPSSAPAKPAW